MTQKMEHRMNIRMPVSLPARVYYPDKGGHGSFRAVTRDLGFGGAFIEAGENSPAKGSIVRLALTTVPEDPVTIDALVLRSENGGFGVMFAYYSDEVFKQLASVLEPVFERNNAYEPR